MEFAALTGVIVTSLLFAAAPQVPALRRLLRIPNRESLDTKAEFAFQRTPSEPGLKTISAVFVRITAPERDPLGVPGRARFPGRFHRANEPAPLYVASEPTAAWAEVLGGMPPQDAIQPVERRVSFLAADRIRVLDVTDARTLLTLGFSMSDLFSIDLVRTQRIADVARSMHTDGLLVPSRIAPGASTLVLFADAVDRMTVIDSRIELLSLAEATPDPALRRRLSDDEQLVHNFVAALEDGRFEAWLDSDPVPHEEIEGLRRLGETFGLAGTR